ncbi:MAG: hypothetical protein JHC93_07585 [Parachlamydiales bacterium]|nr:hypothetical protein [Parachlamydiales bacterium]
MYPVQKRVSTPLDLYNKSLENQSNKTFKPLEIISNRFNNSVSSENELKRRFVQLSQDPCLDIFDKFCQIGLKKPKLDISDIEGLENFNKVAFELPEFDSCLNFNSQKSIDNFNINPIHDESTSSIHVTDKKLSFKNIPFNMSCEITVTNSIYNINCSFDFHQSTLNCIQSETHRLHAYYKKETFGRVIDVPLFLNTLFKKIPESKSTWSNVDSMLIGYDKCTKNASFELSQFKSSLRKILNFCFVNDDFFEDVIKDGKTSPLSSAVTSPIYGPKISDVFSLLKCKGGQEYLNHNSDEMLKTLSYLGVKLKNSGFVTALSPKEIYDNHFEVTKFALMLAARPELDLEVIKLITYNNELDKLSRKHSLFKMSFLKNCVLYLALQADKKNISFAQYILENYKKLNGQNISPHMRKLIQNLVNPLTQEYIAENTRLISAIVKSAKNNNQQLMSFFQTLGVNFEC